MEEEKAQQPMEEEKAHRKDGNAPRPPRKSVTGYEKHLVKCPSCGRDILDHMTACPFCKAPVAPAVFQPLGDRVTRRIRIILAIVLFLGIFLFFLVKYLKG